MGHRYGTVRDGKGPEGGPHRKSFHGTQNLYQPLHESCARSRRKSETKRRHSRTCEALFESSRDG